MARRPLVRHLRPSLVDSGSYNADHSHHYDLDILAGASGAAEREAAPLDGATKNSLGCTKNINIFG